MNIAEKILARGEATAPAVVSRTGTTSYGELRRQTQHVSDVLRGRGHAKGERIGILAENSPFFVAAYLGTIRAGLVAVPMQAELTPEAQLRIARESGLSTVLVSTRLANRARDWMAKAGITLLTEQDLRPLKAVAAMPLPPIDPGKDLAALMFTSGSTGAPKAVMITHRNIECNALDIIGYLNLGPADRVMVVLPFHYCFGLSLLHTHLLAGASLVLNNDFKVFPEQVIEELQQTHCTGFAGVPSTYQILLRRTSFCQVPFPHLRWFQQAGGKLPNACIRELRQAFPHVSFFLMYGQTEATARLSYLPPERLGDKLGSIGRGLPSTRLEVLKANGTPVVPGSGETGEIVASGQNIALGYWNDPKETSVYFPNGKLRTGDLARVDEDGFIFFVERERDMIKPGGNRVSAKEIEDALAEIPEVVEAAVVGVPHELLGEAMVAFIAVRPDTELTPEQVERHCRKRLPAFKVPQRFRILDSLPHNSAGKIQKHTLREMAREQSAQEPAPARSPAPLTLAGVDNHA